MDLNGRVARGKGALHNPKFLKVWVFFNLEGIVIISNTAENTVKASKGPPYVNKIAESPLGFIDDTGTEMYLQGQIL